MVYSNVLELIGNTPMVELKRFKDACNLSCHIYAKLESFNPAGSCKDRIALAMVQEAIDSGRIKEGTVIVEPTSGNTGVGLAAVCSVLGIELIVCMPERMSLERHQLIRAYGAKLELTDSDLGMNGSINHAKHLLEQIPGSIMLDQFNNPSSPTAHYNTTGKEIYDALDGKVDVFIAGVGTGGTITGVSKYLKEQNKNIEIIGVEPKECPFFTEGKVGVHKIQGLGSGFVPGILNLNSFDRMITVCYEEAKEKANLVCKKEGLLVGVSSGAALHAASIVGSEPKYAGKNIAVILPDDGMKYLSTDLYE